MLKPYSELRKIDVLPFCEYRKAKDDKGNSVDVPYLNWAKCIDLLHENGAEDVYYEPIKNADGGYLFVSKETADKNGRTTGCYFVSVKIHIDDKEFTMDMPLMNGSLVIYDDTLNQLRIDNCHKRAFVKGVAIRTGLGFNLWISEKDTDSASDDLSMHNVLAIKQRIELLITQKMKRYGFDQADLCRELGIKEKQFVQIMASSFSNIALLEERLKSL